MTHEAVVHVIDDDEAMRDSLAFLLDSANLRSAVYESAEQFLALAGGLASGCILTDVRMPGMGGLELVRRLQAMGASLPVVMMTGHADVPLAVEAMKAGVADFIEKPFDDETMLRALRSALDRNREDAGHAELLRRVGSLSGRERQVLEGLIAGRANKVIAQDLGISPRTVEVYRANVMTKMAARSLSELVRMALSAGVA